MQVQVGTKHKMLAVPFADNVHNLFPAARQIQFAGAPHLLLPHQPTETFLLRRLGFEVPAPILTHYDWCGGTPFSSQKSTAALLTSEQHAYVLNGMGTGKTKSALWAFDYLRSNNVCGKMLVSAPLSTLTFTWAREVFNTLPRRKVAVLHGAKKQRLAVLPHDLRDGLHELPDLPALRRRQVTAQLRRPAGPSGSARPSRSR